MRRAPHTAAIATLLTALALAGCGASSTPRVARVPLASSAIQHGRLPALYTCQGKNISPPLTWGTVPPIVQELALFALEYTPNPAGNLTIGVEWVLAGVNPALHHINAGEIPRGAFPLIANKGKTTYSICPPKGRTRRYEFALYAIPPGVRVSPELAGIELLSNLTNPNPKLQAPATGAIAATYRRQ